MNPATYTPSKFSFFSSPIIIVTNLLYTNSSLLEPVDRKKISFSQIIHFTERNSLPFFNNFK